MIKTFPKETTLQEFIDFLDRAGCCGIRSIAPQADGSTVATWDSFNVRMPDK